MTKTNGRDITIDYGDFGIKTPVTITNTLETDTLKFEIYDVSNNVIVKKDLPYKDGKWIFELTKEESEKLNVQTYLYSIKQHRDGVLQNTINKDSLFKVE